MEYPKYSTAPQETALDKANYQRKADAMAHEARVAKIKKNICPNCDNKMKGYACPGCGNNYGYKGKLI
jgi:hypothetical protein